MRTAPTAHFRNFVPWIIDLFLIASNGTMPRKFSRLETESVTNRNLKSEAMLDSESWAGASASINFKTCAWAFVAWQEIHFLHLIGYSKKFHSGVIYRMRFSMWFHNYYQRRPPHSFPSLAWSSRYFGGSPLLLTNRRLDKRRRRHVMDSWTPGVTREHLHPPCTSQ